MVQGIRPYQEAQRIAGREIPAPRPEVCDAAAEVGLVEVGRNLQSHQAGGQAGRPIHEQAQEGIHPQDCTPAGTDLEQVLGLSAEDIARTAPTLFAYCSACSTTPRMLKRCE